MVGVLRHIRYGPALVWYVCTHAVQVGGRVPVVLGGGAEKGEREEEGNISPEKPAPRTARERERERERPNLSI